MIARPVVLSALAVLASSCSSKGQGPAPADPPPSPAVAPSQPAPAPAPPAAAPTLKVTGLEPSRGTADGGARVTIQGEGFLQVTRAVKVYFGARAAAVLRFGGDGELLIEAPGGKPGEVVDVRVIFEPGGELTLPRAFTYVDDRAAAAPPPLLDERNQAVLDALATGTRGPGTRVAAFGEDFTTGTGTGTAPAATAANVGHGTPTGDFRGLTADEIDRVVLSRKGLMRACYQRELARKPDLAGKVTIRFTIDPLGAVSETALDERRSTLDDDAVVSCVRRQFQKLRFPAKGGAEVTYPLAFSPP